MLKEVTDLFQEMRGFMANRAEEKLVLASSTNNTNVCALSVCTEACSKVQEMHQVPKCFKFPQADRKQG